MELKENQAALILEASAEGEITVDVQAQDLQGFASALCHALAIKLMNDEQIAGRIDGYGGSGRATRETGGVIARCPDHPA